MTWAEDRAPVGTDPSADPGAVSERRAAGCRPPSPFAYSTNAINPIRNYYLPPANPRLPGFHFTLNQDNRIWVMDRGMVSKENIAFLQHGKRQYIVGTPKSMLKRFERELPGEDWHTIRDGLEVKLCPTPDGEETFVLCRSRDRREKEKAMHNRFEQRIEEGLRRITTTCQRQRLSAAVVGQRVGRLLGRNSRAAGLFAVDVQTDGKG